MSEFSQTPMGKRYYEQTLPALIESQNRLAKAIEEANLLASASIKQNERRLKLEHSRYLFERGKANIND